MTLNIPLSAETLRLATVELARNPIISAGEQEAAFQLVTQEVAAVLAVERCSIWLYNSERNMIVCQDLFQRKERVHSDGYTLTSADFPSYFHALDEERIINADDAVLDPRTREFADTYLRPLGIRSMLDAPIRLGGVVVGVVCQEHVGSARVWTQEEQEFAASIGDLVALAMDLSQRKQAEQALRESEELFRAVTVTATDAIICTNSEGQITIWNRAATSVFGFERLEVMGKSLSKLGLLGEQNSEGGVVRSILTGTNEEDTAVREVMGKRKGGEQVPVEISVAKFQRSGGWHNTYIVRDITSRKQFDLDREVVAQRTQQAQKLESLGVLAGGIAHDFNNLLGAALGRLELLRLDSHLTRLDEHLDVIEVTMKRGADLCSQLLAYSGRGAFVDEVLNLNDALLETVNLIEMSISKKAVLTYELSEGLPALRGDPAQIQQVIMNMLTNASDALKGAGGHITVRTGVRWYETSDVTMPTYVHFEPGEFLYLEVEDTGEGMEQEVQKRLFEPFFTTKFTGRGLGLAAVLGIVRRYGGAIFVSSCPGQGTTMRVLFPALEQVAQSKPIKRDIHSFPKSSGTILLVDDEEDLRSTVALVLEESGFQVVVAADGSEAHDIFSKRPDDFDCVLLDLLMPKMDGKETLQAFRQIRKDVPVVLTSGYSSHDFEGSYTDDSCTLFIQKPFQLKRLINTIQKVMQV